MSDTKKYAPVEITLYDENDEPKETYSKSVIRWGLLKKAVRLSKMITEAGTITEEVMEALSAFVCNLFDDRFTVGDLEAGADISEIMTCFRHVVNRANMMGNA